MLASLSRRLRRQFKNFLVARGVYVERLTPEESAYLQSWQDESAPLPPGAAEYLRPDHPRLRELQQAYAAFDAPVTRHSRWRAVPEGLILQAFRGDSLYMWHYRERQRITDLKFFVFLQHVQRHDPLGLLARLTEDGAFGCWTHDFGAHGRVSRDLLESVLELNYLERAFGMSERPKLRVLDIGAGYGRLAHRMAQVAPSKVDLADYCCVDAIPESTFLSEYYLRFREVAPPARVAPLTEVPRMAPGSFDLALNIHSFPECTYDAVAWWVQQLERLRVPALLIVPNDGRQFLTTEADGSRRDFLPLLQRAGYALGHSEAVIDDPVVRRLMAVHDDHFHLFRRAGA